MESTGRKLLVCDCDGTMPLDAAALGRACGQDIALNTELCRAQIATYDAALEGGEKMLVCCTQEAPLFAERAEEAGADVLFTNIRERAGWSDGARDAMPKIAALIAEAQTTVPPARSITVTSEGRAIVYGTDERAIEAAGRLGDHLAVTIVLAGAEDVLPPRMTTAPLYRGRASALAGHFGAFRVTFDGLAPARPSSRGALAFEPAGGADELGCDVFLDLTGGDALIGAPEKRDGYLRADPANPAAVERALFEASGLVGEFEKPIYVDYDANLCTHSRSGITGCTRCLDTCPASAITPDGDGVAFDHNVCAGCGGCAGVCPTGAVTYSMPAPDALLHRLRTLLMAYREAGGAGAVVLLHDMRYGDELITMMARLGRGLPARVLPFAVNGVTQVGFDFLTSAIAYGAERVLAVVPPARRDEAAGLAEQIALANAALSGLGHGAGRIEALDEADPAAVADRLYGLAPVAAMAPAEYLPMGGKRTIAMMALEHFHHHAPTPHDVLELPTGAPFGAVVIDVGGCTLCLSCIGACPTGALLDNPDAPMVRFNEHACVQCGLCRSTCPESVITLVPRFDFTAEARRERVLHEEEPFACVSCGKPFGVRASVERTIEKLTGHAMFANDPAALERLRMCDDCRVNAQFGETNPMAGSARPLPRTTDDYLSNEDDEDQ